MLAFAVVVGCLVVLHAEEENKEGVEKKNVAKKMNEDGEWRI